MSLPTGNILYKPENGKRVVDSAVLFAHGLALMDDGTVHVWGESYEGTNSSADKKFPKPTAAMLRDVASIAPSRYVVWLLKEDGELVAWGEKGWQTRSVPSRLRNAQRIWANPFGALALTRDGKCLRFDKDAGKIQITDELEIRPDCVRVAEYGMLGFADGTLALLALK